MGSPIASVSAVESVACHRVNQMTWRTRASPSTRPTAERSVASPSQTIETNGNTKNTRRNTIGTARIAIRRAPAHCPIRSDHRATQSARCAATSSEESSYGSGTTAALRRNTAGSDAVVDAG